MNLPPTRTAWPAMPSEVDEGTVFRSLFLSYPDALLLVDGNGRIVLANPSAAALLGYTLDELGALNVDALVPEAFRSHHKAHRHAYAAAPFARPMGTQMELAARRKDGSEVLVEIALSPLQAHGLPLVVAAVRDIGAYPRVKQALQRARYSEHLANLGRLAVDSRDPKVVLDQVPAVAALALQADVARVYVLDHERMTLNVASGLGVVPGEAVDGSIAYRTDTSPGLVLALGVPLVINDYRSEQRFAVPQAYLDAGLLSSLAVPLSDRGRAVGALAVCSRTAQRFGADEVRFLESMASLVTTTLQRAQSEEALSHAQRLESVGQLTGGIAHDFNNLLTVIQGNLQLLGELPSLADDAHVQQLVSAASRASRRGADLTHKLLAFARRQVLTPTPVDVRALLQSLADMLGRTLDQHIRIDVDVAPSCPRVLADAGQLESALLNLAINARDAMPDGGGLRFCGAACDALPPGLEGGLPESPGGAYVAISVSDSGVGMSEAVKERAFEPFFTTKDVGRGTGLGLSTVYGFVRQSKGAIAIDSTPGSGTTLTMYLPESRGSDPGTEALPTSSQALPEGLRVLLVEDDGEVATVIEQFLVTLCCRVTLVASGEQALLALGPDADFELLLSDIALGAGIRGTELAALAVQRVPDLGVLLMSGFSAELLAADRVAPAHWELLRKPCTRDELAQAMARVVALRTT